MERMERIMIERSKWQKELLVFGRLVNTIVLTGNINDQYPIINEREQRIQGFCSLEVYLARISQSFGYQGIVCYNPVEGFHCIRGLSQNYDVIAETHHTSRVSYDPTADMWKVEYMWANGDRILFASDSPWSSIKNDVDIIKSFSLDSSTENKIFFENAAKLLGI